MSVQEPFDEAMKSLSLAGKSAATIDEVVEKMKTAADAFDVASEKVNDKYMSLFRDSSLQMNQYRVSLIAQRAVVEPSNFKPINKYVQLCEKFALKSD